MGSIKYLAPFILSNLLLPLLEKNAPSRIINVSSQVHRLVQLDFGDLGSSKRYYGMKAYARSKLANILFTYELDRRLKGSGVTVNALHPGYIPTNIWIETVPLVGPAVRALINRISMTPEEGADNTIYLASSLDTSDVSGKYYIKRRPVNSSSGSYDLEIAARLWQVSENLASQL